jgi:hypothetical protein
MAKQKPNGLAWKAIFVAGLAAVAASVFLAPGGSAPEWMLRAIGPMGMAISVLSSAAICLSTLFGIVIGLPEFLKILGPSWKMQLFPSVAAHGWRPSERRTGKKTSAERQDFSIWLLGVRNAIVGGLLTGPVFLFFYYRLDFARNGRPDISERFLNDLCPLQRPNAVVSFVSEYPQPLSLLPEFLGFGMLVGLVIGAILPGWRKWLASIGNTPRRKEGLNQPYFAAISFGVIFGTILGAAVNYVFFSQNDGRPFMKLSTAAFAAQVSVSLYLIFQLFSFWSSLSPEAIRRVIVLGVFALIFPLLFLSLDYFGNLSVYSYCQFYQSWDSAKKQVVPGLRPIVVGALYGGWIGVLVMWTVGGYISATEAMMQDFVGRADVH